MKITSFADQAPFLHFLQTDQEVHRHYEFETALVKRHHPEERYFLEGYCQACRQPTVFLVDQLYGAQQTPQGWLPNWRERLECQHCRLNNRQRALIYALQLAVAQRLSGYYSNLRTDGIIDKPDLPPRLSLYAMEQVTPLFHWLTHQFSQVDCVGSEYLGEEIAGGTVINGLRHENVEQLSFQTAHFDLIISNDVLEHVNHPIQAMQEIYRVLKPSGELLITIPFHANSQLTVRRAKLEQGQLHFLLPPLYHGNPLSAEGALVFHDFGWDFVDQLKTVGFEAVGLIHYWSYLYGYLGEPQYYFRARKPNLPF